MTDLIVVPQAAHWQRLKALVLDSVSSPITRRVYNLGRVRTIPMPVRVKVAQDAWTARRFSERNVALHL